MDGSRRCLEVMKFIAIASTYRTDEMRHLSYSANISNNADNTAALVSPLNTPNHLTKRSLSTVRS